MGSDMPRTLKPFERDLLNLIQKQVPLAQRPFAEIARQLGVAEDQVIDVLRDLKTGQQAVIRQISAIFDTKALGYRSSLVAAKIAREKLDQSAAIINTHPGVSHNYQRNHEYNLWYTIAIPPDSKLGLEGTVDILHRESGAMRTRLMPTLRLFKIGVMLNLGEHDIGARDTVPAFSEKDREAAMAFHITDQDQRMIRVLQQDLPIEPRPFDRWAQEAQVDINALLSAAAAYQDHKQMRRFSAVLHHREAGFMSNAMGVWVVPADRQEQFGEAAGKFSAVSHCYLRPTYEDWPYNVFTMVHAPSKEGCEQVLKTISDASGIRDYSALFSSKEYKKIRVQYFMPDVQRWEDAHA